MPRAAASSTCRLCLPALLRFAPALLPISQLPLQPWPAPPPPWPSLLPALPPLFPSSPPSSPPHNPHGPPCPPGRKLMEEMQRKREAERERFAQLGAGVTGRGAETVRGPWALSLGLAASCTQQPGSARGRGAMFLTQGGAFPSTTAVCGCRVLQAQPCALWPRPGRSAQTSPANLPPPLPGLAPPPGRRCTATRRGGR